MPISSLPKSRVLQAGSHQRVAASLRVSRATSYSEPLFTPIVPTPIVLGWVTPNKGDSQRLPRYVQMVGALLQVFDFPETYKYPDPLPPTPLIFFPSLQPTRRLSGRLPLDDLLDHGTCVGGYLGYSTVTTMGGHQLRDDINSGRTTTMGGHQLWEDDDNYGWTTTMGGRRQIWVDGWTDNNRGGGLEYLATHNSTTAP